MLLSRDKTGGSIDTQSAEASDGKQCGHNEIDWAPSAFQHLDNIKTCLGNLNQFGKGDR